MWEQYKRTFVGMQAFILVAVLCILIGSHRVYAAGVFLIAMQLGALFGAMWGARLKRLTRGGFAASANVKNMSR
ncbi:MAG TPA: hypothetical protein VG963_32480 [Polyangiaceae bacterium]|nr:hypothetical protein [Polyangiaceae bacterium]